MKQNLPINMDINGRQVTLDEIKNIELNLLEYLRNICSKNGINLYLTYGTLLGAERHQGFIPWDDDIDVMILRDDYYHLIEIMQHTTHLYYKFISPDTDDKYSLPLAKLYDDRTILYEDYGSIYGKPVGVYVDIFILDNIPDSPQKETRFFTKARQLRYLYGLSTLKLNTSERGFIKKFSRVFLLLPFKCIGYKHYIKKYDKYCKSLWKQKTYNVGIVLFGEGSGDKERIPRKCLSGQTSIKFEGKRYLVPDNYKQYLIQLYGDYMTLPSEEKRRTKHRFKAYWKTQ